MSRTITVTSGIALSATLLLFGVQSGISSAQSATPKVTLKLWDNFSSTTDAKVIDTIIKEFEALHPDVAIKRTVMSEQAMQQVIKPALVSHQGPDIFYYQPGPGYLGLLASDGLLLNLTPYAKAHGWYRDFPSWILHNASVGGQLFGLGNEVQALGVYYNKAIFQKYRIAVPKTYAQFLADCSILKAHHIVPVEMEDKDQWPGFHLESVFYTSIAGRAAVQNVLDGKAKQGFNQPVFAKALNNLQSLVKMGYTSANPDAISYNNANNTFAAGGAAMTITGSWMVSQFYQQMGDKAGFFALPPAGNNPDVAPGGIGKAMVVSKSTPYPVQAQEFINFMFSKQTAGLWLNDNIIPPLHLNLNQVHGNPLFKQVVQVIDNPKGMSYSLDVLMPQTVNNVTQTYMQEILAGQESGKQAVAQKQQAFAQALQDGTYQK